MRRVLVVEVPAALAAALLRVVLRGAAARRHRGAGATTHHGVGSLLPSTSAVALLRLLRTLGLAQLDDVLVHLVLLAEVVADVHEVAEALDLVRVKGEGER